MASLYYHKYNVLKLKILTVLYNAKTPMSAQDIADALKMERKRVTDALCHWHKNSFGYTKRLSEKPQHSKAYLYKITDKGIKHLGTYEKFFSENKNLNIQSIKHEKYASKMDYYGISKTGIEMGYTQEDIPELMKSARTAEDERLGITIEDVLVH